MPSQVRPAENLLEQVAEHALDDDYYVVRAGERYGSRPASTPAVGVVVAILAVLVTVAAVQTQSARPGTELERATLAADVEARREVQAARERAVESLREQVTTLQGGQDAVTSGEATAVNILSAAEPVRGDALVVTIAGSADGTRKGRVTVDDVLTVVNGLWYAGAEAVAVGGQRLSAMSPISTLDGSITVNFKRIEIPVRIVALGDSESLRSRLESNAAGQHLASRASSAGISAGMARSDDEQLPAAPGARLTPGHADPVVPTRDTHRDEGGPLG